MRKITLKKICALHQLKAFTLAEVLITLTIIGVVAAVTVPTLTKKTGNQEYVTRLQKAYSTLSQATDEIILEKGNVRSWGTDANSLYDAYRKHLRDAKECTWDGCFYSKFNWLNGSSPGWNWSHDTSYRKFILADGSIILVKLVSDTCSDSNYGSNNHCARIFVDVNGKKQPNTFGRDLFYFALKEDGLYPGGCDIDINDKYSGCTTDAHECAGSACTCRVLTEGAMNY